MNKDTGGPAFPIVGRKHDVAEAGMTLRDFFAAKAMQAYFSRGNVNFTDSTTIEYASIFAYRTADKMLEARTK